MSNLTVEVRDLAAEMIVDNLDIHSLADKYKKLDDSTLLGDSTPEMLHTGDSLRRRGYMTVEELKEIASWKTPRSKMLIRSNDAKDVEELSRVAFQLAGSLVHRPSIPAIILCLLRGVQLPTASTILTVWSPQKFGVLDIRAWSTLSHVCGAPIFTSLRRGNSQRAFRPADYDQYIAVIREISQKSSLTCREVDMALFAYWDRGIRGGNLYA